MHRRQLTDRYRAALRQKGESGQALIETAITLSLLVIMLIGAAEIARVAYASMQVVGAAKAAVQYGDIIITNANDTQGMQNAAAAEAPLLPNLVTTPTLSCLCADGISCTSTSVLCAGSAPVQTLTVTTSASFDPLIHLPGLPNTFTLQGYAVQKVLSDGF